jgi:hypothetical protein
MHSNAPRLLSVFGVVDGDYAPGVSVRYATRLVVKSWRQTLLLARPHLHCCRVNWAVVGGLSASLLERSVGQSLARVAAGERRLTDEHRVEKRQG